MQSGLFHRLGGVVIACGLSLTTTPSGRVLVWVLREQARVKKRELAEIHEIFGRRKFACRHACPMPLGPTHLGFICPKFWFISKNIAGVVVNSAIRTDLESTRMWDASLKRQNNSPSASAAFEGSVNRTIRLQVPPAGVSSCSPPHVPP